MPNCTFCVIDESKETFFDECNCITVFDAIKAQRFTRAWLAKRKFRKKLRQMKFDAWCEHSAQQRKDDRSHELWWSQDLRKNMVQIKTNLSELMRRDKVRADYKQHVFIIWPRSELVRQMKKDEEKKGREKERALKAEATRKEEETLKAEATHTEEQTVDVDQFSTSKVADLTHVLMQQHEQVHKSQEQAQQFQSQQQERLHKSQEQAQQLQEQRL